MTKEIMDGVNHKRIILGISVVVVTAAIIIVTLMFQSRKNKKWFDGHQYIHEISKEGPYTIKRITDKKLSYHFGDEFATDEERHEYYRESNPKERINGHVFYDTLKRTFWVETSWYGHIEEGSSPDPNTEWLNIDLEGNVIDKKTELDSSAGTGSWIMLKTEITNFYNWKDPANLFYVQHFSREKFNWKSLNPLRGFGNPTGGPRKTYWEGMAYLKLQLEGFIQFKTKTRTTDSGYEFRIDLYRLPQNYNSGRELTFIYIDDVFHNRVDKGLYVIIL